MPAVQTEGTGSGTFALNEAETELSYDMTVSGLSGPVTDAHFHQAPPGESGGVVFGFFGDVSEEGGTVTATGVWPIGAEDLASVRAGNIYVNSHTAENPAGEARGQVLSE